MIFRDKVTVRVASGKGGNGVISFRREKYEPRGGPDGGDGGVGGSVFIKPSTSRFHLGHIKTKHYRADNGKNGEGGCRSGHAGDDIEIEVPLGTQIWECIETSHCQQKFQETKTIRDEKYGLKCEVNDSQEVCIAKGGRGGIGNFHFRGPTNQTPRISTSGAPGEIKTIYLRLRIAGDIGFIGAPNAGKSSLLRCLTNATPEVGDYPFTTKNPQIGVTSSKLSVIDIPGLIKGAHQNKGLGHEFLDHIAKCKALVCVLDVTNNPEQTFGMLMSELQLHSHVLQERVKLVALNKIDLVDSVEKYDFGIPYVCVSATEGRGIKDLEEILKSENQDPS